MEPGFDRRSTRLLPSDATAGLWRLSRVQSIFGGTTEIMKEIIGRGLGL
jgi:alkylation response protein AidB-like acyl-CoA dehydrogenase